MHRTLFLVAGWISLMVGLIGIVVPLLPTTPFAILAAYCFKKGSPQLHHWLLTRPKLGPAIAEWEQFGVIQPAAKRLAVSLIVLAISYPVVFLAIPVWGKAGAIMVGLSVIIFILSRPSHKR